MEELAKYHHQSVCSPPKSSFLRAISNKQFRSFTGLTYLLISKRLPPSTATEKGHMIRQQSGVQSTRHNRQEILDARQAVDDLNLPQQLCTALEDCMYCFAVLGDMTSGTIYTDLCGLFPVTSYRGMKYIFVAYIYKCNSVLMRPMKGRTDKDMVEVFQDIYGYLRERDLTPALHVMDNKCSKAIKTFIQKEKVDIQLVEPPNHRVSSRRCLESLRPYLCLTGLSLAASRLNCIYKYMPQKYISYLDMM